MNVSEQELQAAVRAAIARHLGPESRVPSPERMPVSTHASHMIVRVTVGESDGSCVIEPAVACTHCGYCQSFGH